MGSSRVGWVCGWAVPAVSGAPPRTGGCAWDLVGAGCESFQRGNISFSSACSDGDAPFGLWHVATLDLDFLTL